MNSIKSKNQLLVQSLYILNQHVYSSTINQIKIPNYIPRGKTEILEALASTVKQSPHFLPYGFFNDPRLSPRNSREFRNYALAKESGIKAAQYFMKNYPELFYRDQAEPKIESFSYPDVFNENMEFELDDLVNSIDRRNVNNAIISYKKLTEQQLEIPDELRLKLFELVCFFNSKDAYEFIEELPFSRKMSLRIFEMNNIWNENGFAEQLWADHFSKLDNQDANSAYILGLIRFGAFDKAYNLFKKNFENKKQSINLEAFNSLIRSLPFINILNKDLSSINKFLELINQNEYNPTIDTFNSFLFTLTFSRADRNEIIKLTEKLLLDLKTLNLQANLGTYGYVLSIFYSRNSSSERNSNEDIIYKIVDKIEKNPIKLTSKDDLIFFDEAMKITAAYLHDVDLAKRIFDLFEKHNDMYLNYYRETNIYENFFIALAKGVQTDELFSYYDRICPGIFFPSPLLFETLVDHLIVFNGFDYLEKFFNELDKYMYYNLNNLNNKVFHLMVSVPRSDRSDQLFADYLFKSLNSFKMSQARQENELMIEKNTKIIHSLMDNLILIDREVEVTKFIIENGFDILLISKKDSKRFFSKLLTKLIIGNKSEDAIKLLKFLVTKEIGEIDNELLKIVNNSKLNIKEKNTIKALLILCNQ